MSLTFFKIGKADSILISYQDQHVLIDAGEDDDAAKISNYFQTNNNERTPSFVEVVSPRYAVITSSDKHVEDERTVHILDAVGAEVYTTRNGNIEAITDGKTISIKQ